MTSRSKSHSAHVSSESAQPAPYESRFVDAGGLRLHYLDYGTEGKRPLLCVHGGAAHAHWFDFIASGFSTDHHVLALDLRGHGESARAHPPAYGYSDYASDVASFAQALDLRDFVLVGHSMGGMVSLVYAATHHDRLGRLVVVDSSMHLSRESVTRLRDFGTRPPRNYASQEELIKRYRLEPPGTMIAAPEIIRHVAKMSGRELPDGTWTHKFDRSLYSIFERLDGMPYWNHVRVPTLLVKGGLSDRMDAETLAQIRAHKPDVQFVEVPQADHHVTLDNPRGFVEAVRAFLMR